MQMGFDLTSGEWTDLAEVLTMDLRPVLFLERTGDRVRLTWPVAFTNQVVEMTTSLPGIWSELTTVPTISDQMFQVEQDSTNPRRFFRLRSR